MARTTFNVSSAGFVADPRSVDLVGTGAQVDWAAVNAAFADPVTGKKTLPAGKVMVRQANGKLRPRSQDGAAALGAGETIAGLLATAAVEDDPTAALSGHGVIRGGIVYEHLLPDYGDANWAGTYRAQVVAAGKGFDLQPYSDDRAS